MLPFTREQFLAAFVTYNEAIWPAQLVAYLLGLAAVALLVLAPANCRSRHRRHFGGHVDMDGCRIPLAQFLSDQQGGIAFRGAFRRPRSGHRLRRHRPRTNCASVSTPGRSRGSVSLLWLTLPSSIPW